MKLNKVKIQLINEKSRTYEKEKICNTTDVVKLINKYEKLDKNAEETTILICLNTKNDVLCYSEIAKGGINFCNIDIKTIYKTILLCNASKFILVHNHPSGDVTPSTADILITEHLKDCSKLLKIDFLDHVIISNNGFTSCFNIEK